VGVWALTGAMRRRARRKKAAQTRSDPSSRLRVIGDASARILADVDNVAFEPVVMRSVCAVSYGVRKDDGSLKTRRRRGALQVRTTLGGGPAAWVMGVCCGVSILAVLGLHLLAFRKEFTFNYFEVIAGLGLGVCVSAFVRPEYVRLAPGVLDVMRFGVLGLGGATVDRYDLRRARLAVEADRGFVRVDDPDKPGRRVLYVNLGRLLGAGDARGRAFMLAARSTHPTPPLPMDSLD
jgi:hypothetical protein